MRPLNIVLFSSGISESNGLLNEVKICLESYGYVCNYWRDLFLYANDIDNIALLPMLIKKIPTFDFAVLICEGHDKTVMLRGGNEIEVNSMRDNVLFEIGLCAMGLGLNRTILLTDGTVRLPDDLNGVNKKLALKHIVYETGNEKSTKTASHETVHYINNMQQAIREINKYIHDACQVLSPVIVGAAATTACGYVGNFILRTLEHIHEGVILDGCNKKIIYPLDKIKMHIILPEVYTDETPRRAALAERCTMNGCVPNARLRKAEFKYLPEDGEAVPKVLNIVDFPTTIVTSYNTAKMILEFDADDVVDTMAEERFTAKELDLFKNTVRLLLNEEFVRQTIDHYYQDNSINQREAIICRVNELIKNNVTIETQDY